jgi:beta-phosphoglucomutase-like phosphatase (HAD superfamily)
MTTEALQSHHFEALIFDMDGVLINSEPLHECAKREALREAGIVMPESLFCELYRAQRQGHDLRGSCRTRLRRAA